jgi:predicted dehydrogenase
LTNWTSFRKPPLFISRPPSRRFGAFTQGIVCERPAFFKRSAAAEAARVDIPAANGYHLETASRASAPGADRMLFGSIIERVQSMAMNLGILGFAHGHVGSYCRQWRANPSIGLNIAAGWDHDAARAAKAEEEHGVALCSSARELVARDDIQAVAIGAETAMHAEMVELAAEAGKAIILQKPIALTLDQADRIVAAVERTGVPFTMAWQMRVDPQNVKMKELVEAGTLGRVFMLRRRHCLSTHTWPWFPDSWHNSPEMNRDIFADDAAHAVDFIYWMLGMPVSVTAELGTLNDPRVPNDHAIAVYRFADGTFAEAFCSFACLAGENTTEIVGERGVVIQNYGDSPSTNIPPAERGEGLKWYLQETKSWTPSGIPSPEKHGERIAGLAGPLAEFLRGERPPIATAREGRDVLRMILACYESAEAGRRVALDSAG